MTRLICLGLLVSSSVACASEPAPLWLSDLGKAQAAARASGRPIFIVFRCEH